MRARQAALIIIFGLSIAASGCATGAPKLLPNSIRVSKPTGGVSTVSFAGRVTEGRVTGISFYFPRRLPKSITDESKDLSNQTVLIAPGFFGDYAPFTVGSPENPTLSGDVIVADAYAVGFVTPTSGEAISIVVP